MFLHDEYLARHSLPSSPNYFGIALIWVLDSGEPVAVTTFLRRGPRPQLRRGPPKLGKLAKDGLGGLVSSALRLPAERMLAVNHHPEVRGSRLLNTGRKVQRRVMY
ncbi:hypothetical protein J6590_088604 [Homalodisca vitripennis]|nr:hypothetical protein J6590_088604 [Homalodisca vitripennis]